MNIFRKPNHQTVPKVHTLFATEIKKRRQKYFFLFLSLLVVGFLYAKTYINQQIVEQDLVEVLVANQTIAAFSELETSNFEKKFIPRKFLPNGIFLQNPDQLEEKLTTISNILENQVLVRSQFFTETPNESVSLSLKQKKGFLVDQDWFESEIPAIGINDTIDILATNPKLSFDKTFFVVQNITVSDIVFDEKTKKRSLLLEFSDDEAKLLLFSRGSKLPMALLIHAPQKQ